MTTLIRLILSTALLLATCSAVPAQTREGVDILLSKARSLEARGRTDLAAQNWNQVLLVNPNQTEALEGLARHAKQNGDAEALRRFLERLRKIDPDNPAIEAIEKARVLTPQDLKLLDDAGGLAAQQKPGDAMAIYRRVFGDTPPPANGPRPFTRRRPALAGATRDRPAARAILSRSRERGVSPVACAPAHLRPGHAPRGTRAARVDSRSWRRRSGARGLAAGAALGERQPGSSDIARGVHSPVSRSRVAEQPQRAARISGAA
jgi:tetratricopeptide (TPR) repeat protein